MAVPAAFKKIAKIKSDKARSKADEALDKSKGIKEGSKKDAKIDKALGVSAIQYGKGKK
jgi:hypothetical protein